MADNDKKIEKIVDNYQEIVSAMNTKGTKRNGKIESWTYTIVAIVAIVFVLWGATSKGPRGLQINSFITAFTIAITAITWLSRTFTIQQKHYSTLETILFKLIDLEKECTDDELTCKIHQLIQVVSEKMYK